MGQDRIAVFGSSEPAPGEPLFELARKLGRSLAEAGFGLITGGYGGVMEAAGRGAHEAGGCVTGVTCEIFASRSPNAFLDEEVATGDLHDRTRELMNRAAGFVVMDGKAGTLSELAFLWALHHCGCLDRRPVVLLGRRWSEFVEFLKRSELLDREQLDMTHRDTTVPGVVAPLRRELPRPAGGSR